MHSKFTRPILFLLCLVIFCFIFCIKEKSVPVEPENTIAPEGPVEDTTRIYLRYVLDVDGTIVQVDTLPIYPKAVFARFYPWVTDTSKIEQLVQKHHLRIYSGPSVLDQQLAAILCVTDDRRAEYHFTPYGKEGFCNFGADSLVEYAFGVFADGYIFPSGDIVFKFVDHTPQTRIDSLFDANGLRFLWTYPDYPTGTVYCTLVTPRSEKNVLDLGCELQSVPFVIYANVEIFTRGGNPPIRCDE